MRDDVFQLFQALAADDGKSAEAQRSPGRFADYMRARSAGTKLGELERWTFGRLFGPQILR
jgi:hypothetical protein